MDQDELANHNRIAWEYRSFDAWVYAYGFPAVAAANLIRDPQHKLRRLLPYLQPPANSTIANPLGSHGRVAVALALLGAEVTVFDLSASNRQYALELATAAGVRIGYELGDFIDCALQCDERFDQIVFELGVLHYFTDINTFVRALSGLLKPGGIVVFHEFHPLLKKAIGLIEEDITLAGDYFSTDLETAETPFSEFIDDATIPPCLVRRWNLGDIVTAFADGGFRVKKLIEEPASRLTALPGTFILVAEVE